MVLLVQRQISWAQGVILGVFWDAVLKCQAIGAMTFSIIVPRIYCYGVPTP